MIRTVIDCFTVKWCTLHCDSSKMPTYWCLHSFEPKTSKGKGKHRLGKIRTRYRSLANYIFNYQFISCFRTSFTLPTHFQLWHWNPIKHRKDVYLSLYFHFGVAASKERYDFVLGVFNVNSVPIVCMDLVLLFCSSRVLSIITGWRTIAFLQ